MSSDLRDLVRAYLGTLRPREAGLACGGRRDCSGNVIGAAVPTYDGTTLGVCAECARDYVTVAPLPPRAVALRALVAHLDAATFAVGGHAVTPDGREGVVLAVEGARVWLMPLRDIGSDHPGAWWDAVELTPAKVTA